MPKQPDIRVVVGAERIQSQSVIEQDLQIVANDISNGSQFPRIAVGIDVSASRALFEKQLKDVTKGLKVDGIQLGDVSTSTAATVDFNMSAIEASISRLAGAVSELQAVAQSMSKTPLVSNGDSKALEDSNRALSVHAERMQGAVDAEAQKAMQSMETARALRAEEEALDSAAEASDEHAKTIKVNTTKNIREFERQVTEKVKDLKRLEGYELESASASRDADGNITGMRLTYNNPQIGAVYQADYIAKELDEAEGEAQSLTDQTIQLERVSSRIVKHQKDLTAEIRKTVAFRDKEANKLAKRAESLRLSSLDPNAKKKILDEDSGSFEEDYKAIQESISTFRTASKSAEDLKHDINEIVRLLDAYEAKMKSSQNARYAATQLAAKDVSVSRQIQEQALKTLEANYKNAGITDSQFIADLGKLNADTIVDANSLTEFINQLDKLKARLKALRAEQKQAVSDSKWISGRTQTLQGIDFGATKGRNKLLDTSHVDEYQKAYKDLNDEMQRLTQSSKALTTEEKAGIMSRISALRALVREYQTAEKVDVGAVDLKHYKSQVEEYEEIKQHSSNKSSKEFGNFASTVALLNNKYDDLNLAVAEYNRLQKSGADDDDLAVQAIEVGRLDKEYQDLVGTLRDMQRLMNEGASMASRQAKAYRDAQSVYQKAQNFRESNNRFGINPDLASEWDALWSEIQRVGTTDVDGTFDEAYIQKLDGQLKSFAIRVRDAGLAGKSFFGQLNDQLSKLGVYLSGSAVWDAMRQALRDMLHNVVEIDTAMTELKKVTDETAGTYDRFLANAADRSIRLGATLSDVITATADFARLGHNIDAASVLADAAIVYKNVGDGIQDISTASESIISTMQAFGISAEEAMMIVDKFNEVGNNFAISSRGIGEALLRSASSLAASGNTLDETIALITAMNTTLQDSDVVGTSLKTISMRLRNTSGELEELGEDAEGAATSVTQLQTQLLNLTGGRVNIMADDDTFKSTYQIMVDLASVWGDLTDTAQADITRLVAGVRQGNALNALLSNMQIAEQAVEKSANSAGSALKENEKYLDSIAGKVSILNAEWEALSTNTIDSGFIKFFVDGSAGVLSFINSLGGLMPVLTAVGGLITAHFGVKLWAGLNDLPRLIKNVKDSIVKASTKSEGLIYQFTELKKAFAAAKEEGISVGDALSAMGSKTSVASLGFSAFVAVLSAVISGIQIYIQHIREMRRAAIESAAALDSSIETISEYKKQIGELNAQLESGNLSEQEAYNVRGQLLEIQEKIIDAYGREASAVDLLNDKTDVSVQKLDALAKAQIAAWEAENADAIARARKDVNRSRSVTLSSKVYDSRMDELHDIMSGQSNFIDAFKTDRFSSWEFRFSNTQEAIDQLTEFSLYLAEFGDEYADIRREISREISRLNSEDYTENLALAKESFDAKLMLDSDYLQFYEKITGAQERYNEALAAQDDTAASAALHDLYDLMQNIHTVADDEADKEFFEDLFDPQVSAIYAERFSDAVESDSNNVRQKVQDSLDKIKMAISKINGIDGDVELDNLSLLGMIDTRANLSDGRIATDGVAELIALADDYHLSVEELVDSLVELGYVQGEVLGAPVDDGSSGRRNVELLNDAVREYNDSLREVNALVAEQSQHGYISEQTFNRLAKSGSKLVDILDVAYDELGNPIGFKLSENAAEDFAKELKETAMETLRANDATSEYYLSLGNLVRSSETVIADVSATSEKIDELTEAYVKAAKEEQFTHTEMLKLTDAYPALRFELDEATGAYDLQISSVQNLIKYQYELLKALQKTALEYAELAAIEEMQTVKTRDGKGSVYTESQAAKQINYWKSRIDESGASSFGAFEDYVADQGGYITNYEPIRNFIENYITAKNQVDQAIQDLTVLETTHNDNVATRVAEEKATEAESIFEKQKTQLDMEHDALEAGRTLEDRYRQFRLTSEADYWDRYEQIVHDAYARNELDAVEYQNHLTDIFEGRKGMTEDVDTYEINNDNLELEREALKAGFQLEEQYRKYGIASEKDYWNTKLKIAKDAYDEGLIDTNEYLRACIESYEGLRNITADEYSRSLDLLNQEKAKMEAGMVWNTSVLTDLSDYYDKFEKINEERFRANLTEAEEYVNNVITIFEGRKGLLDQTLADYEHDIFLWQQQNDSGRYSPQVYTSNTAKMLSTLEAMQEMVHRQADAYREEMSGAMSDIAVEHSDFIVQLQRQWWDYQKQIDSINEEIFSDALDSYKTYIQNCNKFSIWGTDSEIAAHKRVLKFLESSYKNDLITYERYLNEKLDLLGDMYDAEKQRQDDYIEAALYTLNKEKEILQEELDGYEKQKSAYETMVSTVTAAIDERIAALREENNEINRQIELENALEAIEKARSQRTKRVYVEGEGFVWQADEDAIRAAQKEYDDLKEQAELDDQIAALEEYKKQWEDVVDSYEKGIDEKITAQILGNNWQKILTNEMIAIETRGADGINYVRRILNQRLLNYSDNYRAICDELDDTVEHSTAYQISQLDALIGKWQKMSEDIRLATTINQEALNWAREVESASYADRLAQLENFRKKSISKLIDIQNSTLDTTIALRDMVDGASDVSDDLADIFDDLRDELDDMSNDLDSFKTTMRRALSGFADLREESAATGAALMILQQMMANSTRWHFADDDERLDLEAENRELGAMLNLRYNSGTGTWHYKDGEQAYDISDALDKIISGRSFSSGGVVDYTGLAMVHGASGKAETVFNASDSAKLYDYVHSVPNLVQALVDHVGLDSITRRGDGASVSIGEIHLHNVQDVDGLANAIVRTLPLRLAQKIGR